MGYSKTEKTLPTCFLQLLSKKQLPHMFSDGGDLPQIEGYQKRLQILHGNTVKSAESLICHNLMFTHDNNYKHIVAIRRNYLNDLQHRKKLQQLIIQPSQNPAISCEMNLIKFCKSCATFLKVPGMSCRNNAPISLTYFWKNQRLVCP